MSERGTLSRSIPNKDCSSGPTVRRWCSAIPATSIMYGLASSSSNHSATSSRNTDGAKGRNDSRYLTFRFSTDCMLGERASPRIERAPKARGPNSIRPWNQPSALPSASASTLASISSASSNVENRAPAAARRRSTSPCPYAGPR